MLLAVLASGASANAASTTVIAYGLHASPAAKNLPHSLARCSVGSASHARRITMVSTNDSSPTLTPHATVWWKIIGRRPPLSS